MKINESADHQHLRNEVRSAAIIRSATGEHFAKIMDAGDYEFELGEGAYWRLTTGQTIEAEALYKADLDIELSTREIDVRKNVPQQVASQLLEWSEQLAKLAAQVRKVAPERLILESKAHIIEDMQTGEITEYGPFHDLALDEAIEMSQATGHTHRVKCSPLSEWPEQESQFAVLVLDGVRRAITAREAVPE
ncbi:MAG: hypothetical protein V4719_19105 [Planctomycetota bacterium]